jgi:uncharacterized iron-regulated membrane protein
MLQAYLLRFHRWITLVFAIPLLVVIFTGLILSFQPIIQYAAIKPGSLTLEKVDGLIAKHDPENKARALFIDPYENSFSLLGVGPEGSIDVDLTTGADVEDDSQLSEWMSWSRRTHERLLGNMGWLVNLSTAAMLVLAALGVAMGWPRIRNTVSGWHKATGWFLLPLVVISPLTGLFLAYNVTFNPPPQPAAPPAAQQQSGAAAQPAPAGRRGPQAATMPMRDIVRMVAQSHDLSTLNSISNRGGRMLVRLNDGGLLKAYVVSPQGLTLASNNWPRLIHEGNWGGVWGGVINVITSIALLGLLLTGLFIWARRTFRKRPVRNRTPAAAAAQAAE